LWFEVQNTTACDYLRWQPQNQVVYPPSNSLADHHHQRLAAAAALTILVTDAPRQWV